uniref:S1 motif domain-containing protein n=1 Tax=Amphora coffeiformis TaxID=265554 RepID=A0A7S3L198_9STRA
MKFLLLLMLLVITKLRSSWGFPILPVPSPKPSSSSRTTTTTTCRHSTSSSASSDTATTESTTTSVKPPSINNNNNSNNNTERRVCYYQSPVLLHNNNQKNNNNNKKKNPWVPRLELSELQIGQELQATIVQELLQAKTGPKVFCEVGVGRYRPQYAHRTENIGDNNNDNNNNDNNNTHGTDNGNTDNNKPSQRKDWKIVTAMLRLGPPGKKESVARKRAQRLRNKPYFPVYVSRIRLANTALEVCLTQAEALEAARNDAAARGQKDNDNNNNGNGSTTTTAWKNLVPGQVVTGRVVRVEDYGVLVQIDGAQRRHGLLHIQTVADLLGRFIDKKTGLIETAGLERGTRVQLQVGASSSSSTKKGKEIALEFTDEAQQAAAEERQKKTERKAQRQKAVSGKDITTDVGSAAADTTTTTPTTTTTTLSKEEEEAWAAFAANPTASASVSDTGAEEDEEEEYDDDDDDDKEDDRMVSRGAAL